MCSQKKKKASGEKINNFYQKDLLTSRHFLWIINEKEGDLHSFLYKNQ